MYFLFSGEGSTDLGVGRGTAAVCEGDNYQCGPMAVIADQLVAGKHGYSLLESRCCGFVSESSLLRKAAELKAAKKSPRLPGANRPKETGYFFNHARLLARIARDQEADLKDDVVAALFRDCDGTASAGRGLWKDKYNSMLNGFSKEKFCRGVPMVPKPTSEAWMIAGFTGDQTRGGKSLEEWSSSPKSPNPIKRELAIVLGMQEYPTAETQCDMVRDRRVDIDKIQLPSFVAFKGRLLGVI